MLLFLVVQICEIWSYSKFCFTTAIIIGWFLCTSFSLSARGKNLARLQNSWSAWQAWQEVEKSRSTISIWLSAITLHLDSIRASRRYIRTFDESVVIKSYTVNGTFCFVIVQIICLPFVLHCSISRLRLLFLNGNHYNLPEPEAQTLEFYDWEH